VRILIIQLVPPPADGRPRFRHDLGVAAAVLAADGFELSLAALGDCDGEALRRAASRHRPTHVLMDIPPTRVSAARHLVADVSEKLFLPVLVVGPYATSQPDQAISMPTVTALIRGEYERSLLALCRGLRDGPAIGEDIPGVWLNSEEGLVRNEPAPPAADLDALPFPDREIFDGARRVAETHEAAFRATRGCPRWCGTCLNDWYLELYGRAGAWPRRRSVGNVLAEIAEVRRRCGEPRRIVFRDHAFADDADWLEEFADRYRAACGLPFRCRAGLDVADAPRAETLARAGCRTVEVEIGSGSSFIREDVLGIRVGSGRIAEAVAALRDAGLRVRADAFVGAPYETEVSIEETLEMLCDLRVDEVRARVYYPVPGTRAAELCAENGWISGRGEANQFDGRSVLDMPSLSAERIADIARHFEALLKRRSGRSLRARLGRLRRLGGTHLKDFRRRAR